MKVIDSVGWYLAGVLVEDREKGSSRRLLDLVSQDEAV